MTKFIIFCVSTMFIKTITSQIIYNPLSAGIAASGLDALAYANPKPSIAYAAEYANPWSYDNYGLNLANLAGNGCGFAVQSRSPIVPKGVSVLSENMVIEGPLAVNGQMPFLGSIGVEGALPASGAGVVSYGGGNGNVGITNEAMQNNMQYAMGAGLAGMPPNVGGMALNNAIYGFNGYY